MQRPFNNRQAPDQQRQATAPVAQQETNTVATPTETPAVAQDLGSISDKYMFTLPAAMKVQLEEYAKTQNLPVANFVRRQLASVIGYNLIDTVRTTKSKYATEDEKKQAKKDAGKTKRLEVKNKLAAYKAQREAAKAATAAPAEASA